MLLSVSSETTITLAAAETRRKEKSKNKVKQGKMMDERSEGKMSILGLVQMEICAESVLNCLCFQQNLWKYKQHGFPAGKQTKQ